MVGHVESVEGAGTGIAQGLTIVDYLYAQLLTHVPFRGH